MVGSIWRLAENGLGHSVNYYFDGWRFGWCNCRNPRCFLLASLGMGFSRYVNVVHDPSVHAG